MRVRMRAAACGLAFAIVIGIVSAAPGSAARPAVLKVGSMTLYRCTDVVKAWCGSRRELLDPSIPDGPRIKIGFVWYPAISTSTPAGTMVADEGGPGWPSTGSASAYRTMYGPLLATRNLLLVDNRGTGRSSAIDCPALQDYEGTTVGRAFQKMVGACGRKLNRTWRAPGGAWIHASDLFGTAYAVNDMADVIGALGVAPVDLYGDSTGTWFAQSFLSRYPSLLRSVILDSAYPLFGGSVWYPSAVWRAHLAFTLVCERDPACRRAAPRGDPWARIAKLLRELRRAPITGEADDPNGGLVPEKVDARELVNMVENAGFDPIGYRDLDASVRAALQGDRVPILRLAALADHWDNATPRAARVFSDGLYFAVSCEDYAQLWHMRSPLESRRRQLAASERREPQASRWFRPFTADEWAQTNAYSEAYTGCLDWPRWSRHVHIPPQGHPAPLAPSSLPVLVMNGELDSWTSPAFGPKLIRQLGPRTRFVQLANSVHTAALGDTPSTASTACADRIVQRFVRAPGQLFSLDTSCARHIPPVHTPGSFPLRLDDSPAASVVGGHATLVQRRGAVVVGEALGDSLMSWYLDAHAAGPGLRGGRFVGHGGIVSDFHHAGLVAHFHLDGVRWVEDATVSGTATWHVNGGQVRGTLELFGPGGLRERLAVAWSEDRRLATAHLIGAGPATLRFPAP